MPDCQLTHANAHGVRYPGGKNAPGTWQWITAKLPTHAGYAEPFAGSGAVLRRKTPALQSVVCDLDRDVCRWWTSLRLPGLKVVHGCGLDWLTLHYGELDEDWVVYLDPPYPLDTRTKKRIYSHELTDEQHRQLLGLASHLRCRVLISSYANALYEERLAGWRRFEREVMTRGGIRTEVLWCNFDPEASIAVPAVPAIGDDYRERERTKRKRARWLANYKKMPAGERQAVLAALIAAEAAMPPARSTLAGEGEGRPSPPAARGPGKPIGSTAEKGDSRGPRRK